MQDHRVALLVLNWILSVCRWGVVGEDNYEVTEETVMRVWAIVMSTHNTYSQI